MKLSASGLWTALVAAGMFCGCPAWAQSNQVQVMKGLRLPGGFDEKGNLKSQLYAGTARTDDSGNVEVEDMRLEFYENGVTGVVATTPACSYNKSERLVTSDKEVRIERGDVVITGVGFRWRERDNCMEILDKVTVILPKEKGLGVLGDKR